MKDVYIDTPKACQIGPCARPAEYDVPTWRGPWANLCADHLETEGGDGASRVGFHLVVGEAPVLRTPSNTRMNNAQEMSELRARQRELRDAIESGDFDAAEDIIGDGDIAEWL